MLSHILLVEDQEAHAELVQRSFSAQEGHMRLTVVGSLAEARAFLTEAQPDLIVADLRLPDGAGIDLLSSQGQDRKYPLIVMSSHGDEQLAVQALKAGALDYLVKSPSILADLPRIALRAVREWSLLVERERAEREIIARQTYLEGVLSAAPDAIVTLDARHCIVEWNPGAEKLFGYKRKDVIGKSLDPLITNPDTLKEATGFTRMALSQQTVGPVETMRYRKDGSAVHVRLTGSPIVMGDELIGAVAVYTDITEHVRAHKALQASEERYRGLIENASIGIVSIDTQGNIREVNPKLLEILGSPSAAATRAINMFAFPPLVASGVAENFRRCIETGETFVAEHPYTSKWGKESYLRYHLTPVRDAAGVIVGALANVQDISDQVQAEAERARLLLRIQQQAQQVQQIIDTVPAGVLLLDDDGHILLANPAARQALSALIGESIGAPLIHLGSLALSEILAHHTDPLPVEIALPGFPPRIFEAQARPIGESAIRQWVLTLRDVTQERVQQRQIQAQERLATVGQLAAGIAHDFNNIMASIVLYAKMMLNSSELSERDKKRLGTIHQQGHRAANLVQQILDFARKSVMERQPLDLVPFLKELEKLLERTLPENIHIHLEYGHEDYLVYADPTRIQQVVMNLALNARDAMPAGGDLRFQFSRLGLESGRPAPFLDMPPGEWVRLDVSDTGAGIAPDVLPHIFEPFFTTKEVGQGTGLGLAQVYGIVAQHEGFIGVQSHVGYGTTFSIYLPALALPDTSAELAEEELLIRGRGETILVVEDDVIAREAIAEVLDDLGYHVLTASNGQEALDIFGPHVDLVLSDWVMPQLGGGDLYAALRSRHPHVKMVVTTGYPLADEGRTLLESGIAAWLKKPFSAGEIAEVVQKALE